MTVRKGKFTLLKMSSELAVFKTTLPSHFSDHENLPRCVSQGWVFGYYSGTAPYGHLVNTVTLFFGAIFFGSGERSKPVL